MAEPMLQYQSDERLVTSNTKAPTAAEVLLALAPAKSICGTEAPPRIRRKIAHIKRQSTSNGRNAVSTRTSKEIKKNKGHRNDALYFKLL